MSLRGLLPQAKAKEPLRNRNPILRELVDSLPRPSTFHRKGIMRTLALAIVVILVAQQSTHAQTANPAASLSAPSAAPSPAANSSGSEVDPALNLRGMPCSVSLNATGGVTTASSCGSDPLEVPARTVVSPDQVDGSQPLSVQTSGNLVTGGTQSSSSSGGTTSGSAVSGTRGATAAATASSSAAPSASTLCSTTVSATGGPTGAASLIGGC